MNIFRFFGDLSHLASIFILIHKIQLSRSCRVSCNLSVVSTYKLRRKTQGISFKTQLLYTVVFVTRYLDIFVEDSFYRIIMKLFFIGSSVYILYLMRVKFR
ncbi:hypothetical protein L7F22_045509 [Adiantum nelumboides]|nr:hypothetical protein [Adiantum nelumboides]